MDLLEATVRLHGVCHPNMAILIARWFEVDGRYDGKDTGASTIADGLPIAQGMCRKRWFPPVTETVEF